MVLGERNIEGRGVVTGDRDRHSYPETMVNKNKYQERFSMQTTRALTHEIAMTKSIDI